MSEVKIDISSNTSFIKSSLNYLPFILSFIILNIVFIYELFVILPFIDNNKTIIFYTHAIFGSYIYLNIIASAYYMLIIDTSTKSGHIPNKLINGWIYCYYCEDNSPPRSRHCYHCNVCILRKDHHCSILSKCVGYKNHRYYITLILYVSIGSWYCSYLNIDYAIETVGRHSYRDLISLFIPVFSWMFQILPNYTFAVIFVSITCLFSACFFTWFTVKAFRNLVNGRILDRRFCHDHPNNPYNDYDRGTLPANLAEVFGSQYLLSIFSPFIKSPLSGDGFSFSGDDKESPKDL